MANVLVVGAAESCLGMIHTVKDMGHKAIIIASDATQPGYKFADHAILCKDNDLDNAIKEISSYKIDAIVPTPVDRPLVWQAQIAEKLRLPFISVETALNFRFKHRMKRLLYDHGVPTARWKRFESGMFTIDDLTSFSYPLIVKPVDGYASRGVVLVNKDEELLRQVSEAIDYSSDGSFLVEEFVDGMEYNAEGICFDGNVEIYAIVEKIRDPFPRTIEMGHVIPPNISVEDEQLILSTVVDAVHAMGMKVGAFNAEIKVLNGRAKIIEVNGRLAGDFIVSHLIEPTTGQDMQKELVKACLGQTPEKAKRAYQRHGIIRFYNLPVGRRIISLDFASIRAKFSDDLVWVKSFFEDNTKIPEVLHMGHRSGFFIILADNRRELDDRVEYILDAITSCIQLA
jgi:biotin carboxylase